jgi:hypothetical protein
MILRSTSTWEVKPVKIEHHRHHEVLGQESKGSKMLMSKGQEQVDHRYPSISQEQDHQEQRMMVEDMRLLTEKQMAAFNMIKLTVKSMRSLVEQHDKTSKMIMIIMNQMTDNNVDESGKSICTRKSGS